MKKGLRPSKASSFVLKTNSLEIDLMKKGLRLLPHILLFLCDALEIDLMKKGLRQNIQLLHLTLLCSRNRPDEKGIKTTALVINPCGAQALEIDLMKKGLRREDKLRPPTVIRL
nr:hypothetical protein HGMM_F49B11C11 [uncultured Gammaproteobacteria bacterium]